METKNSNRVNHGNNDEITIKGLFDIFLPKLWLIALVAVVFAALLGGYSKFIKDEEFTSTASFVMVKIPTKYTGENTSSAVNTGLNANEIEAMQAMIGMSERVMKTTEFLTSVKEELVARDERYSAVSVASLKSMLSVKVVGDATCFDISAVSTDSRLAFDVTDIVYQQLPGVIEDVFDSYAITIKDIDEPVEATAPNAKNTLRNAVIGFVGGALVAALAVFIISRADVVIRSREKIEDNFDIPILGVIPRLETED